MLRSLSARLPFGGRPARTDAVVTGPGREPLFDEAFLGRVRRLVLLSGRLRAEGLAGTHRSRRRGSSPEFADFKSYSPGDDFRRIDWNTYARLDSLFVRLSEVTTELSVHLLVDASDSMDWSGAPATPTKFTYARRVAGALGYVALWHFDRLAIAPVGPGLGATFGPSQGRANVVPMLRYLEAMPTLGGTALAETVERYVRARQRPGLAVILSDLLTGEPADLRQALRTMRARGWHTVVLHLLDEAEVDPVAAGRFLHGDAPAGALPQIELVERESGRRLQLAADEGVLERYAAAVAAWLAEIDEACRAEEAVCIRLLTSQPFDQVVLETLHRQGVVA